jgi:U3 small nucleolar RNA-associated protein 20
LLNLKYEHKEGRVSAIRLVSLLIDRFPIGLLDEQVQIIFLPLVLQLVNDDAEICRELVSQSLLNLIRRVSKNCALALYDYAIRWHKDSNKSLIQASLQLFGIFAQGRKDFPSQTECVLSMFRCLQSSLESRNEDWEQHYYALKSFEKVWRLYSLKISEENDIWDLITLELCHPHLWVKLISSRIIRDQLKEYDPQTFLEEEVSCPQFLRKDASLYRLASSFCSQLDQEEANISSELSDLAIASLSWLVRAMYHNPQLCYAAGESEGKEPVKWLLTRLSTIAKWKGTNRRKSIFKCFAAFCHSAGSQMIRPYLELIIEPLFRSTIEAAGVKDNLGSERFSEESNLAQEVLSLLEESCEHDYVVALSSVKLKFRQKHEQRKSKIATERVSMPEVAAKRKMVKQTIEKERRKRRVDDYRKERGATIKKSRY